MTELEAVVTILYHKAKEHLALRAVQSFERDNANIKVVPLCHGSDGSILNTVNTTLLPVVRVDPDKLQPNGREWNPSWLWFHCDEPWRRYLASPYKTDAKRYILTE